MSYNDNQTGQKIEKEKNKKLICNTLLKNGPMTKKQLAKRVGISVVSISKNADELIEKGVLLVDGFEENLPKGRKPIVLRLNKTYKYIIAVDLGKNPVDVCVGDLAGDILFSDKYAIKEEDGGEDTITGIILLLFRLLAKHNIASSNIGGIVIANPGVTINDTGVINRPAQIAQKWADMPIANIFEANFNTKRVIVKNDINLAALAMLNRYSPIHQENYILMRLDAGIGMGIVIDGKLYEGEAFNAGELGFMTTLDQNGNVVVESYENIATLPAFITRIKKQVKTVKKGVFYEYVATNEEEITIKTISNFAKKDPFINNQIEQMATMVGIATLNALLLLDINTVILDGDILLLGKVFVDRFKHTLNSDRHNHEKITVRIAESGLPLLGCLKKGSDEILDKDI